MNLSEQDLKAQLEKAEALLASGEVLGLPTETVYGLAARIDLPQAIEKIFKVKERPFFDPLIVHVSSLAMAETLVTEWKPSYQVLAEAFWPGPLTLILPKSLKVNDMITSGLESVGIRMPRHPLALRLIEMVQVPLAAPSANKFGKTSPTSVEHVQAEFQYENVFVLDGGLCDIGIESTVLWMREEQGLVKLSILRKGHVLKSDIEKILIDKNIKFEFLEKIDKRESPGHMKHHYMPAAPLIVCLDVNRDQVSIRNEVNQKINLLPDEIESIKIIKPVQGIQSFEVLTLSEDPVLATREFYSRLRESAHKIKTPFCFINRRTKSVSAGRPYSIV